MAAQHFQGGALVIVQRSRLAVHDAQSAERVTARIDERRSGIEAHPQVASDPVIGGEARVLLGIRNLEDTGRIEDRLGAKRRGPRRFGRVDPDLRLQPLPLFVDQRDIGHGRLANPRCEKREIVERSLRTRVEDPIVSESGEPPRFVIRRERAHSSACARPRPQFHSRIECRITTEPSIPWPPDTVCSRLDSTEPD